ncbi:MAG TPA: hypothetical protein VIG99_04930 [Myxococcaceae bacterium]
METRILRVRTTDEAGVQNEVDFDETRLYLVTDEHPELQFLVEGLPLMGRSGEQRFGEIEQVLGHNPSGQSWFNWTLGEVLSKERRMGAFAYPLVAPKGQALRCYVVPTRLLDGDDYLEMVREVEQESGKPVLWDARRTAPRTWVERQRLGLRPQVDSLVQLLTTEVAAASSLARAPLEPIVGPGRRMVPPPEQALVARWASRRMHHIAVALEHVQYAARREETLRNEPMPKERRKSLDEERRHLDGLRDQLRRARRRVAAFVRPDHLGAPFSFGPLAQRDHRLRRLLAAFDPSYREIPVSTRRHSWSRLPQTTFNDLFERWGAVWIVQQLRALGFAGGPPETSGVDRLWSARWRMARGDVQITLDYEAHPQLLTFDGLPLVSERRESAIEWAARQYMLNPDRPIFGTEQAASPDYLLRFEGPRGRTLAVGDATLADPKWHDPNDEHNKVNKVAGYRRTLFWWTGAEVIPCDPLGAFALYPGPPDQWTALESVPRGRDVWLIAPRPRGDDVPAAARFRQFIERMLERVQA